MRGGGDGEFPAKDKWNSNSLKCKLSSETTSPQIYCYCYFFFFFLQIIRLIRKPVNSLFFNLPSFLFIFPSSNRHQNGSQSPNYKTSNQVLVSGLSFVQWSGMGQQRLYCPYMQMIFSLNPHIYEVWTKRDD